MKILKRNQSAAGVGHVAGAYLLWGILPIYWKLLQNVPPVQILAHRIAWAFGFLLALLLVTGKFKEFWNETTQIAGQPRKMATVFIAAVILNLNWLTYIWAVNNDHIVQASLGYYINPLVSVMLGVIVLKERLSMWQLVAFLLAAAGVFSLTLQYGALPWVAIVLALTYVLYTGSSSFGFNLAPVNLLLMGAGAVTAIPLVLFAAGTRLLPLVVVGFLQYISPTITLLLGVMVYHEPFTRGHLLSFGFIWVGLLLFSLSRTRVFVRLEEKITQPGGEF